MMDWTSILGAVLGGASSGDAKQTTTADKTPWGPTQGWLTSNLGLGQSLQNSYMANPLSAAQQAAYNNSFATTGLGRSIAGRVLPQLSSTQFFDRTNPLNRPTPLSFVGGDTSGAGAGTNGSLGLGGYMPTYSPTVNASGNGVAAVPTMANNYGGAGGSLRAGWDGQPTGGLGYTPETELSNPSYTSFLGKLQDGLDGYGKAMGGWMPGGFIAKAVANGILNKATVAEAAANQEALRQLVAADPSFGGGGYRGEGGTTSPTGAGIAANPMARDPAQAQGQGIVAPATESAPAMSWDKDSKSWVVGSSGGGGGGGGHDYSGIGGGYVGGGIAANPMGRDPAQAQGGFAKGGMVRKKDLHGPDPKGPDEGKANLQSGEYVIKKAAVKKYGKGLLSDINNMKA